jgi:polar amino acid transport system substrate-binding protein
MTNSVRQRCVGDVAGLHQPTVRPAISGDHARLDIVGTQPRSLMPMLRALHAATTGRLAALALALALALTGPCIASDQKLSVVTEDWVPYNYSENGVLKGVSVDTVRAIAQALNAEVDIELLPSMRASALLNGRRRTMLITMLRTPEREDRYKWIGPLGDSSIYFYKRKGDPLTIATLQDASHVRAICSRQGGLVPSRLKAAGFNNIDLSAFDGKAVYRMLIFGRCDLAISDTQLGVAHLLRQMGMAPDAVEQTQVKLISAPLYIASSKDVPDAEIARWQKALDQLKSSGAFKAILKKYTE